MSGLRCLFLQTNAIERIEVHLCMYVFVCMRVCMSLPVYVCMGAHCMCFYACIHVCMYSCMHVCMYESYTQARTHTHTYTFTHTYLLHLMMCQGLEPLNTYIHHIHPSTHEDTHTHIHTHLLTSPHDVPGTWAAKKSANFEPVQQYDPAYFCKYKCMQARMCICTHIHGIYVHACVCVCVRVYVYIYIYIYIYMHTQ